MTATLLDGGEGHRYEEHAGDWGGLPPGASLREIADVVVFLCSPGASYVTGTTLHVNGGMAMI